MPAGRRRLPGATHRPHRPRNVLDALLPHVLERKGELVAYLIANHPADADPAWLGQGFEPCRDIHTVAENALALGDHVAQVDTDAELDPLLGRDALILLGHAALDLDGAPNGIDHARKLGKEAVAGVFYDTAAVFADLRIDQLLEVGFEPLVGAFLVRTHQTRVTGHIGGEDRGQAAVERPTYDLTIFKLRCGKLTLKIYTKGERVLRIEAVAHHTQELNCRRSLEMFPQVVSRLKAILERFADALSCIDQCFIADEMLERLPLAAQVGKTRVGGIDLNKARMRQVIEALIALSPSPNGFTASEVAARVRASHQQTQLHYGPRQAAYDLKKLRGKHIVRRIGHTRRYEPLPSGLRAMTALLVLRNKAIKPLLAAAQPLCPTRGPHNPKPIDRHYHTINIAMQGVFHELGLAA